MNNNKELGIREVYKCFSYLYSSTSITIILLEGVNIPHFKKDSAPFTLHNLSNTLIFLTAPCLYTVVEAFKF